MLGIKNLALKYGEVLKGFLKYKEVTFEKKFLAKKEVMKII